MEEVCQIDVGRMKHASGRPDAVSFVQSWGSRRGVLSVRDSSSFLGLLVIELLLPVGLVGAHVKTVSEMPMGSQTASETCL